MVAEAEDLDALTISSSVKLAGGTLIGAGVCVGIAGVQLLGMPTGGFVSLVGPVELVLSGGCVFSGWGVVRGRARSADFGIVLGLVTGLFALTWFVFAVMNGFFSPVTLAVLPLAFMATLLIWRRLKDVKKIDEARERLRAQGLDAGL
jgi:hypothetical protein